MHTRRLPWLSASMLYITGLVTALSGCSKPAGPELDTQKLTGNQLHGTVSYNGTPLPYGYLKFAHLVKSRHPRTGLYQTAAMAAIKPDGSYTATNVPEGFVLISVFTDPDLDRPMPSTGKQEEKRSRPMPAAKWKKSNAPKPPNLALEKLQLKPEQIEMLKQVHEQYGDELTSGVVIQVSAHSDEVLNLDLKTKVYRLIDQ
jgi:hypothetical protein